jgi:hypothetical protein
VILRIVGLADRDYMKRQRRRDPYVDRFYQSSPPRTRARLSTPALVLLVFVAVFGVVVLPYFVIDGKHWQLFFL